jgi:NADPH:quinone reductase-like Zn-dependent oxidoreductase
MKTKDLRMETASKFIIPGILFLLTLAAGVWLSQSGRPLNTLIFTVHKLIALAAVMTTTVQLYGLLKGTGVQEDGKIKPVIAQKLPILEAARANELLESGQVIGNIALLAPELL